MKKQQSRKKRSSFISAIRASKGRAVRLHKASPAMTKNYHDKRVAHGAHGFSGIRTEEQVQNLMANLVEHLQNAIEHFDKRKQEISVENVTLNGFTLAFFNKGKRHERYICFRTIPNRVVFRMCNQFIRAYA